MLGAASDSLRASLDAAHHYALARIPYVYSTGTVQTRKEPTFLPYVWPTALAQPAAEPHFAPLGLRFSNEPFQDLRPVGLSGKARVFGSRCQESPARDRESPPLVAHSDA